LTTGLAERRVLARRLPAWSTPMPSVCRSSKKTVQIADTLNDVLRPKGVAVVIEGSHQCMTTRGVHKPGAAMVTSRMPGAFRSDGSTRRTFLAMIGRTGAGPLSNT